MLKYKFRTLDGEPVDDVIKYSLRVLSRTAGKGTKIYVGSDSQKLRKKVAYAVCIAFRYGNRGCHVLKYTWSEKRVKGLSKADYVRLRLTKEIEATMEAAAFLTENGIKVHQVDFDLNGDKDTLSHGLVTYAKGWASGVGMRAATKPEELVAAKAANNLVNKH